MIYSFEVINGIAQVHNLILKFSDDIFNQNLNNEIFLRDVSKKYSDCATVVAIKNETETMGYAAYYKNDIVNKKAFLSMIIVGRKFQGSGFGQKLLDYVIHDSRKSGMQILSLEVNKSNCTALKFYGKNGFVNEYENDSSFFMLLTL